MSEHGGRLVVLVEDAPADVGTARRLLGRSYPDIDLEVFGTAEQLLEQMDKMSPQAWWPSLFIVDVNLGGRTGIELLEAIKSSAWKRIPVVILSGSATTWEVQRSYDLGAAGYVTKPLGVTEVRDTWATLADYWLKAVTPAVPPTAE